jgi:hypothetical protein
MSIQWYETDSGFLVYENSSTGRTANVWEGDLDAIADVCQSWHDGRDSPCHRMMNKDYGYRNLSRTLSSLRRARDTIDRSRTHIDGDDYLDLLTAIEDLEGIVARIDRIAD